MSSQLERFDEAIPILIAFHIVGFLLYSAMEFATTMAILVAATVVVVWASARVFSIAIHLTGKRPSVSEVWRCVRER